ncbi:hypothetical protein ABZ860_37250 [Microbispora sp. NPDC046973]|uniref:hypothetical protein n=1 Tax=Microbispora sp. NPDC046973 TaxID=3155022 RepID=UPI0034065745
MRPSVHWSFRHPRTATEIAGRSPHAGAGDVGFGHVEPGERARFREVAGWGTYTG